MARTNHSGLRGRPHVAATIVLLLVSVLGLSGPAVPAALAGQATTAALPARLTDRQFWELSASLSEPGGVFRSENLVSNEHTFQYVIPELKRRVKPGSVYLGVAPDQNFTYIVATEPRMAFIVDVRRGNLLQHLMYKALLELSADRAEFIARLFSKGRPRTVTAAMSAEELFSQFSLMPTTEALYAQNVKAVQDHLVKRHGFGLSAEDLEQLESIYFAFFWEGPGLRYSTTQAFNGRGGNFPTYQDLMVQTDWAGVSRGYLASEANFKLLKQMQERNLIVPVVGNFAGPKALRSVGRYIRDHGGTVGAFYVSNVEQYLFQDGLFVPFAQNVSTLPLDASSTFIRSVSTRFGYLGGLLGPDGRASALDPMQGFVRDFAAGRIRSYADVNLRSE